MSVLKLAYISCTSEIFKEEKDIDDILEVAAKYNKENDITGILLFKGGIFVQLLEGPEENVKKLYGKICADLRHRNITLLVKQHDEERLFSDWSMGYRKVSDLDLQLVNDVLPWSEMVEKTHQGEKVDNEKIMEMLKLFSFHIKPEDRSA